jgi:hypothetical protein
VIVNDGSVHDSIGDSESSNHHDYCMTMLVVVSKLLMVVMLVLEAVIPI